MKAEKLYVIEKNNVVYIGNNFIELGFSTALNGALVSFIDKTTDYQFIQNLGSPGTLFRILLNEADDGRILLDSCNAVSCRWRYEENGDSIILVFENKFFTDVDMTVTTSITVYKGNPLSTWRLETSLADTIRTPISFTYPVLAGVLKVGGCAPGETIVTARNGEGHIFRNPYPVEDRLSLKGGFGLDANHVGVGEIHGMYPGRQSMQFMLYYHDIAGLYLAAHDSHMNVKSFDIGKLNGLGENPVMSITHFPEINKDRSFSILYDTVVGVFHGDWYDGTDIYKEWATKQWWCEKTLAEKDIPDWFVKGFGIFQMSNYSLPRLEINHSLNKIANVVNRLSEEAGVPLLSLIFNWECKGAWTAPKGIFPPREGEKEFKEAMELLGNKGNKGFVYIASGNWYLNLPYNPPFKSWSVFKSEGKNSSIIGSDGSIRIENWFKGWETTHMCPKTGYTKEQTAWQVEEALKLGCSAVQIDNFPACEPEACYNTEHGHPAGYGSWWAEEYLELLKEARSKGKEIDKQMILSSEGICECFMPYMDMFDQRAGIFEYFCHLEGKDFPAGADCIPLFSYVYNRYIASYCPAFPECNRPEVLYWTRCMGKSLAQGAIPTGGWYFPKPDKLNPVTIGFYKGITRASAQECWKYFMFGDMLRPPVIEVPLITVSYLKPVENVYSLDEYDRHLLREYSVQHSVWLAPDGDIGYFFINISEQTVEFDVELTAYDKGTDLFDVEVVLNGDREILFTGRKLPAFRKIVLPPLSIMLIEVKKNKCD